jgi:hypothetical protein
MFDHLFDHFVDNVRKTTESYLQIQQDFFRQATQQWLYSQPLMTGASTEWGRTMQKRWFDFVLQTLNRQREAIDAAYKSGIQVVEQAFHAAEAKSPEEQRRVGEDLWRTIFDSFKSQQETQFQELQRWTERSFEFAQGQAAPG